MMMCHLVTFLINKLLLHDVEFDDELETETPETPARTSLPRYEFPKVS